MDKQASVPHYVRGEPSSHSHLTIEECFPTVVTTWFNLHNVMQCPLGLISRCWGDTSNRWERALAIELGPLVDQLRQFVQHLFHLALPALACCCLGHVPRSHCFLHGIPCLFGHCEKKVFCSTSGKSQLVSKTVSSPRCKAFKHSLSRMWNLLKHCLEGTGSHRTPRPLANRNIKVCSTVPVPLQERLSSKPVLKRRSRVANGNVEGMTLC